MKATIVFLVALALLHEGANAFTTKKREPTNRAFKKNDEVPVGSPVVASAPQAQHPPTATFAFAPATYHAEEEEIEISVSTAIISCALSLALGFGLGYGT